MPPTGPSAVVVRTATTEDVAPCGQICYDAFTAINIAHGFPSQSRGRGIRHLLDVFRP
jgi:hypothetical protein